MYQSNIRNSKARAQRNEKKREMMYPDKGQEYAYVQELMGNGRLKAYCEDGNVRVGRIRGNMRNYKHKVIINRGDIILISKRDYEDDKVDVIHKYSFEEANKLSHQKELPDTIQKIYKNHDECGNIINHNEEEFVTFVDDDINVEEI
jgi:translation initiation factor 1A